MFSKVFRLPTISEIQIHGCAVFPSCRQYHSSPHDHWLFLLLLRARPRLGKFPSPESCTRNSATTCPQQSAQQEQHVDNSRSHKDAHTTRYLLVIVSRWPGLGRAVFSSIPSGWLICQWVSFVNATNTQITCTVWCLYPRWHEWKIAFFN